MEPGFFLEDRFFSFMGPSFILKSGIRLLLA
jgi:hypothetical protein